MKNEEISQISMGFLAVFVGMISGFGAVLFRMMIGLVHNILFLGKFSFFYDANTHTPFHLGIWVIFIPMAVSFIVAYLVKNFAPEAKGHGVPEVLDAIYHHNGKIRPIVGVIKAIASSITIGSGGSVGREGPFVQVGSAFGSLLGMLVSMPARQRNILIAAGAAGGVAATFNTPMGAVAFSIELMLASVTASSIFSVAIATVTATYIGRAFLGVMPSFYVPELTIPSFHLTPLGELAIFIPFGILLGLGAVIFIRGLYYFEDKFEAMSDSYYIQHALGMFLLGVLIYLMMRYTGHYYVQGVGYATIVDILKGVLTNPWFLLLLVGAKLLATFLTLGSGGSGGIFSPSFYLGATLGAAFGLFLQKMFPGMAVEPIIFAIAGMAGMFAGATGAVMTSIIMVMEMTSNSDFVLPIIITVATAYTVRKILSHESIYTLKLLRRGVVVPEGLQSGVALTKRAENVMNKTFKVVTRLDIQKNLKEYFNDKVKKVTTIVTNQQGKIEGIFCYPNVQSGGKKRDPETYINHNFLIVTAKAGYPHIMRSMKSKDAAYVIVTAPRRSEQAADIIGVISEKDVLDASMQVSWLWH